MNESEIRTRIKSLEDQVLQYRSWLGYNMHDSSISYEEIKRVQEYVDNMEKELKDLYEKLKTAQALSDKNIESSNIKTNSTTYNSFSNSSGSPAIEAQEQARNRFYGMSKLKQSIAKITGKKKKFEALAFKAYDSMTPQEEQKLASEIGRMFR